MQVIAAPLLLHLHITYHLTRQHQEIKFDNKNKAIKINNYDSFIEIPINFSRKSWM